MKKVKIGLEINVTGVEATDGKKLKKLSILMDERPNNVDPSPLASDEANYIKNARYFRNLSKDKKETQRVANEVINEALTKLENESGKKIVRDNNHPWDVKTKVYFPTDDVTNLS